MLRINLLLLFLIVFAGSLFSQGMLDSTDNQHKEKMEVRLLYCDSMNYNEDLIKARRCIGNVEFEHKGALMYCDSAYFYIDTNLVRAFSNVHINQGDTLFLYSDSLTYDGDSEMAYAIKNVRLENKSDTLYSDRVAFNMINNIAKYVDGGRIVDTANEIVSIRGTYFVNQDLAVFNQDVVVTNDNFVIYSDTLDYNTQTKVASIVGPTDIYTEKDSIYAEEGYYNTVTRESKLTKNPVVYNSSRTLKGDFIHYIDQQGIVNFDENVWIKDNERSVIIVSNKVLYDKINDVAIATDSALLKLMTKNEQSNIIDTLFLHADSLVSVPDTIESEKVVFAYYGVRFFRDDVQGVCDSLTYHTVDSTMEMTYDPIVWNGGHQIVSKKILMTQTGEQSSVVNLEDRSFITSIDDTLKGHYNQIKGTNIIAYIDSGYMNRVDVTKNAESLYYMREEDQSLLGVNKVESGEMVIWLTRQKAIDRIKLINQVEGTLYPLEFLPEESKYLRDFQWHKKLRPQNKFDIF
ncbi:MAG: OstA-like protein [Bacteroidales bacterium]